jgi:hypothetical protein
MGNDVISVAYTQKSILGVFLSAHRSNNNIRANHLTGQVRTVFTEVILRRIKLSK